MSWTDSRSRFVPLFLAAALAAAAQTVALAWMVESRATILRTGRDVLLLTVPVDPRDLLRGDYVSLNYEISTISASQLTGPVPSDGKPHRLYVRVVPGPDGEAWTVQSASVEPLEGDGGVVLRTKPVVLDRLAAGASASIRVRYGIERFYVPEGEGGTLERATGTKRLTVDVRVADSGEAQIRSVMIEGKPVFEEPLY